MAAKVEFQVDPDHEERTAYRIVGTLREVEAAVAKLSTGEHRYCRFMTSRLEGQTYGALGEVIRESAQ